MPNYENIEELIVEWLTLKKAYNIEVIDVSNKSSFADNLIICSGSGEPHLKAIAEDVLEKSRENSFHILGKEGVGSSTWILIDFGSVILHIFDEKTREKFNLEDLWKHKKIIEFDEKDYDQE